MALTAAPVHEPRSGSSPAQIWESVRFARFGPTTALCGNPGRSIARRRPLLSGDTVRRVELGPQVEGWYKDPFGRHGDRWFSAGIATNLVRDGEAISHDPPPAGPLPSALTESEERTDAYETSRAGDEPSPEVPDALSNVLGTTPMAWARAHAGCPHRPLSGSRPGPFWAWLPSGHIRRRSQNNGHQSRSADQAGVGRPNSREYAPRGWNRTAAVAPKLLALSATATARESAP